MQLAVAQQNLKRQQELWKQQLTPREVLERAENDVRLAQSTLSEREKQVRTQEVRLGQDRAQLASAQFDLSKVRIESPIAGIVTRRNIQEGETAVVGTMNNAGTVLLTVADMSVIQAEVEVDETNIPNVKLGQTGEDHDRRDSRSHVQGARDGNRQQPDSGDRPGRNQSAGDQLQSRRRARRGCAGYSARVHVHGRHHDGHAQERRRRADSCCGRSRARLRRQGQHREEAARPKTHARRSLPPRLPELEPGQTRKETEGVFVIRDGRAEFVPIKIGVAGDRYFEVLSGMKAGDQVITGPYNNVRTMNDGDPVRVQPPPKTP